jgi:5-methylcytosine-specific restriction protein A
VPWSSSHRSLDLPPDWDARRSSILARDRGLCRIRDPKVCIKVATEVDHIEPGNDHSPENLRAACTPCHARKSSLEGNAKKAAMRRARYRPAYRHPGYKG